MKQTLLILLVSVVVGFGGGYLFYQGAASSSETTKVAEQKKEETKATASKETTATAQNNDSIFQKKQCLTCHAVSKLGLEGGTTGPDLSDAYKNVEGKHGKPIEEFLKEPTSAVMSGVIKGSPLTDAEREQILAALKEASEK